MFGAEKRRPRVAAVITEFRFRSHAYNILENCLGPYLFNGKLTDPGIDIVAMYADQFPQDDMTRDVCRRLKIPLFKTIDKALCVGGDALAVDAVLMIGEHGDYPYTARGQKMYPRKRFFDECVAVMKRSRRFVPLFNDKHLSYRWDWAKEMYDTARELGISMLAGSSVPLAQRVPAMDLPENAEIEEAVSIHGGGLESYGFHALEVLQSFVESRKGGETGIAAVQVLSGKAFEDAKRNGLWSAELAAAAMAAEASAKFERRKWPASAKWDLKPKKHKFGPPQVGDHAIRVIYEDGLRATVLRVGSDSNRWNFACKLRGERQPRATALFNSPWGNRGLFKALSHAIQQHFITGAAPYPVERTLLVTGAVDALMRSYEQNGKRIETPHLEFAYQAKDFDRFREHGGTWKRITKDVAQPVPFTPGFDERL